MRVTTRKISLRSGRHGFESRTMQIPAAKPLAVNANEAREIAGTGAVPLQYIDLTKH